VQGQLVQLNASTGATQHIFKVVPDGCTGGGVWGSPTIDTAGGFVYFATGNPGSCASHYTEAVVKVFASNVSISVDSWQVRGSDKADLDFGSTPTLFTASINGATVQMLGIGNKDGMYYALDRNAMSHGTVWRANIAHTGNCPQCGGGTISPSAWDGTSLYVAGGGTSINGVSCAGSLSALNPTNGSFHWRHCLQSGPVLGAVSVSVSGSRGVAFVGQGTYLMGIRTSDGTTLFRFHDTNSGSNFWGAPAIGGSMVLMGNQDGNLYALGF
jgi:polyvinyl alcohol dehydrogenase (cytochrome)